jgi:glutamine synthetase
VQGWSAHPPPAEPIAGTSGGSTARTLQLEEPVVYRAEYIWIDGTVPIAELRSKTKILKDGAEPPEWGFDGSSTNQATGDKSDVVLQPAFITPDPIRGGDDILVLCETFLAADGKPHPTNTRCKARDAHEMWKHHEPLFGLEQEYTLMKNGWPYGFPTQGFPGPQVPYYCEVGAVKIAGRELVERHTTACIEAGLAISGTNAEVMPGQWEFQIGPVDTVTVGDHVWVGRYLLYRLAEEYGIEVSIEAKPMKGDWNGAGMHTNFSTNKMRDRYDAIIAAAESLGALGKPEEHLAGYGVGIEDRLTGEHETQRYDRFSYGVSDRGASVRIPWQVARDGKGYIEDRRPNANADPYVLSTLMTNTICAALEDL